MARKRLGYLLAPLVVAALVIGNQAQSTSGQDHDRPEARSAWFHEGRQSPDGQPAALHRLQAVRQARRLSIARPTGSRLSAAPGTTVGGWTELGPRPQAEGGYGDVSGRVTALAVDLAHDPTGNTVYVGSAYGGVWESTNALATNPVYTPISDASQSLAVGALALDTSTTPATIYVGTGEGNFSGDSYYGVGILKSSDGGQTWSLAAGADHGAESFLGGSFSRIVVDPANPLKVLAGFSFGANALGLTGETYGVYLSTDGGQNWSLALNTGHNPVTDIVWDAQNKAYYAAVVGQGIYKSSDGGSWTLTASPLAGGAAPTNQTFGRASLATRSGVLYALFVDSKGDFTTSAAGDTGIVQSADGGKTWTPIANPDNPDFFGPVGHLQGWYDQFIAAPPGGTGLVIGGIDVWITPVVAGTSTQWTNMTDSYTGGSMHPDEHAIAVVNGKTWVIGNDGGVWHTTDGGTVWNNDNGSLGNIQFTSVTPDDASAGVYFGGSQDNGTALGSSTAKPWKTIWGGDGGFTDTDPNDPTQYFTENNGIGLVRSGDSGSSFQSVVDTSTISDPSAFYVPYEVMPGRTSEVILGTCRVWMGPAAPGTAGEGWAPISGDLAFIQEPGCNLPGRYILGLASAPSNPAVVYTVSNGGLVQRSTNATSSAPTWTDVTTAPLPAAFSRPFSSVAVSPADANTAYVGVMGFGTGHVFKTSDGGQSWLDITGNLPDAPVNSIVVDPENANDVYVASDVGVFVATDGGATGEAWQRMGTGLPDTAIVQLKLSQVGSRVLVAATHGRGAWAIAPLTNQPDFALGATPDEQSLTGTASGSVQVTARAINGYSGTLTLSCATPAAGCSFSPATLQPGQSSTLTVSAAAITATTTPVTISATDGTITHTDTVLVHPSFTLQITPASAATTAGSTASETVSGQGVPGTETLSCSGLPAGATCSFSPAALTPTAAQSNLTVTVADATPYSDAPVTVIASDGSTTTSAPFNLRVSTFQLQSTDSSPVLVFGTGGTATFHILNSSSSTAVPEVTLGCIHLPGTCSFNPAVVGPNQTSILTVSNLGSLLGRVRIFLTGTSGSETETTPLYYKVEDFSLTAQPTTGYLDGDTATFAIDVSSVGGLDQPVTMSCPNLPAGLACSFAPDAVQDAASTTLTVSGLSGVSSFPLNLNVQGDIQGDTHSLGLTVRKAPFQVTATPAAVTMAQGNGTETFTLTTASTGGAAESLTFSCGAVPSPVACAFTPATVTAGGSTQMTLSGLSGQPVGNVVANVLTSDGSGSLATPVTVSIGDFNLAATSSSEKDTVGTDTVSFPIQSSAVNEFDGNITLSCKGLPTGASCQFNPATVTPGQSSTLTVSGLNTLAAQANDSFPFNVTGTSGGDQHLLPLSVTIADVAASLPAGGSLSQSVTAGQTASYALVYSGANGFSGAVTMSCAGVPAKATCAVSPATFNLAGGASQTVTVTVKTTAAGMALPGAPGSPGARWPLAVAALALLALLFLPQPRRLRPLLVTTALATGLLLAGCGGGGGSTPAPTPPPASTGTPAGKASFTVTATANGVAHVETLTLDVN